MSPALKTSASIILYLVKNSTVHSSSAWISWRETVQTIYEKNEQTGKINAEINSGKISSGKIKTNNDLVSLVQNFSDDEKTEVISLLELYKIIDENSLEYIPATFNNELLNEIITLISADTAIRKKAVSEAETWFKLKKENRFYSRVSVPASIKPVAFDFILRCIILFIFQRNNWDIFGTGFDIVFYYMLQLVVIPSTIIIYAILKDKKVVNQTQSLISKINIRNIRITIKNTAWHYLFIFILLLFGATIMLLVRQMESDVYFVLVLSLIYGIYMLILQTNFSKRVPNYRNIKQQIEDREHRELSGDLSPDQNDEEIIDLEVNLKAENERMNAYVIEAALFGALAFSGYLGVVSSVNFSFENIGTFNTHLHNILSGIIGTPVRNSDSSWQFLLSKNGILVMLSYQLLFCSVFFLSVIASRLRYSKLTDYIDRFLQLSKAMNDKEEMLVQFDSANTEGINKYNEKIKNLLREGYKKQDEIQPIMEYMQFFRTIGIVMFFIIIITGGLFISPWMSVILFFISMLSLSYWHFGKLKSGLKSFYISMQEFYYRADKIIHWVCWSMIILALFLRTFNLPGGGLFMISGFLFLFLHYLLNLFIPVQFDYEIKNADDAFGSAIVFNKILAYIFKISLALLFLAYLLKANRWPGGSPIIISSLLMMSAYFLIVKKVKKGNIWYGYMFGIAILLNLLSLMLKVQHWPGAGILINIGVPLLYISAIIIIFKYKSVRPMIVRTIIILCILSLARYSRYIYNAIWTLSFNYENYENVQKIRKSANDLFLDSNVFVSTEIIGKDSMENIIDNFNKLNVLIDHPNYDDLNRMAYRIYLFSDDTLLLKSALSWSETTIKHDENWMWIDTYAALLYKNNRFKEAKIYAEKAYKLGKDKDTRKLMVKIDSVLGLKSDTTFVNK